MSKVFLTGGAGFVGYYIAKELLKKGDEVVIFDAFKNFIHPLKSHYYNYLQYRLKDLGDKPTIIQGDLRHKNQLIKAIKETKPDKIVHLAALPIATVSNKYSEDTMEINLNGTANVLEAIRQFDFIKRFVFTSSSMTYGDFQYSPADEKHPQNPMDVYGGTKLSGEIMTKVFGKQYGIPYTIIRPSAVYGPTDANRRVSQIFVDNALEGKPLVLHNGGESKLDFSYVTDTAHGFVLALHSDKAINETFNITAGQGRSIKEFAEIVAEHIPGTKIEEIETPKDEKRPERGSLDISKAKKLLGYEPKYTIEKGIPEYIEFVKKMGVIKSR